MTNLFYHLPSTEPTKPEKLLQLLNDRGWHDTKHLARRIGHTFGGAIFQLRRHGYPIERQKHPSKRFQHQYRLTDAP